MERLRDHPEEINALCARASDQLGVPPEFLEKDLWAMEVLRGATLSLQKLDGARLVFKGGTSLSRAFGLTNRFSEDVDVLAVLPPDLGKNARHAILKTVHRAVEEHLEIGASEPQSTTGVKRDAYFRYPAQFVSTALRQHGVLLELGTRGGASPTVRCSMRSMIANFAIDQLGDSDQEWAEWAHFEVEVLAPARTLLEKLAAVHVAVTRADARALANIGRHYYDIGRLLDDSCVVVDLEAMGQDERAHMVDDINRQSEAAGWDWEARPPNGYVDSPAFDMSAPAWAEVEGSYATVAALVYGDMPSLQTVIDRVRTNRELL